MARRINVKDLRDRLGLSQSDLARRIWGKYEPHYKRTIRRWENDGTDPSPMAQKHLQRLLAEHKAANPSTSASPSTSTSTSTADITPTSAPPTRRRLTRTPASLRPDERVSPKGTAGGVLPSSR